jgi:RNA polymerase sigma-70 factor (ECF subfamily)
MIDGFVKVFQALPEFRFQGSFEGWVRRIMVREAIDFLRKRPFVVYDEIRMDDPATEPLNSDPYELEALEKMIEALPDGYRLVFTLYAVEGYKHSEISELLDISESTSKSQLYKARKQLQKQLNESSIPRYGTR